MASSSKDKERESKKSGHRRSSSSKLGDKKSSFNSSGSHRKSSGSARRATSKEAPPANPALPRQNSSLARQNSALARSAGAAPAAATAKPAPPAVTTAAKPAPPTTNAAPMAAPPNVSPAGGVRRATAPAALANGNEPAGAAAAGGPPSNKLGGYGSMGPAGYGAGGANGMDAGGYGSMGPAGYGAAGANGMDAGGYGSMGPAGYGAAGANGMDAGGYGSMGPGGPMGGYGSMGPGGYASMGPAGYGSMGPGAAGAAGGMNGGAGSAYGSMYGGQNAMGSMYGGGMGGGGSMYGMGAPMYNMGFPMGGSMMGGGGSMYGMPMGGSMYGAGMPMGGSMYGGGSMYSSGSMYGLGRYNSMGLGSNYASMYGIGRTTSRSSFRSTGGYNGGSFAGLWRAPSGVRHVPKKDFSIPPPSSALKEDVPESDKEEAKEEPKKEEAKRTVEVAKNGTAPEAAKAKPATPAARAPAKAAEAEEPKKTETKTAAEPKKAEAKTAEPKKEPAAAPAAPAPAPAPAPAKEEKPKSRSAPLALASSHRLTKQVNDNVHVVAVAPNESMLNKADKSVTIGGTTYQMDEVFAGAVDVDKSDLLTDIVEQTHCGHNVSLLALCGSQKYEDSIPTVTAVIMRMMEGLEAEDKQVTQVMASAAVFPEADKIVDLLDEKAAAPVNVELGSNPIYGPCVINISEKRVTTPDEAVEVTKTAATKAEQRGLVVVMYKIKQIRAAASNAAARDVYVSSMLVALVDDANMAHLKAAEKHATASPVPLFTNAIGGASRTVAIVQIPEKDGEATVGPAAANAQQLREIKNTPTRSGNVRRFVDYTERAAAATAKTSPETTAKIQRMLQDAKELLARPEETPLCAYSLLNTASPAPANNSSAAPAAENREATVKAGAAEPEKAAAPAAVPVVPAAPPAEAKKPDAEKKLKLLVCVDGAKPMAQGQADEMVLRASQEEVPETAILKSLRDNYRYGRNVALVSAETQRSIPLKNQYTWKCVENILCAAIAEPAPSAKETWVELFMVAALKREVLCDLMDDSGSGSSAPRQLAVASSPLFGPVVADSAHKTLRAAAQVQPVVEMALAKAPTHLTEPDALIVMMAVLKQTQESKDVVVASFMCASGPSAAGVHGAMSKKPDYSRSLFAYAIGGPCVTALLLGVGDDHESNEAAKSSLAELQPLTKQPNHTSRDGSVNAFLDYAKKGLAANDAKVAKAADGEEKNRLKAASARLRMMHDDYETLVKAPGEHMPAFYLGDKCVSEGNSAAAAVSTAVTAEKPGSAKPESSSAKTPTPIRSVVVVVEGGAANDADAAGKAMEVTEKEVILNGEHFAPSEVVTSKGGTLRSASIDEVHQVALNGYNAAMLTNDVAGSTVGISMAVKTVVVLLRGLPQNSAAFWTVVVSKDNKVKDMLAGNSPYYDLHLASSPLFGNVAYGANISPVTEAQVEPMVREVRGEVRESGGVGYIYVILRMAQPDGDVSLISFLAAIAGDNVDVYEKTLAKRSSSNLLSTAIGGACHTIYVAGIRNPAGESAKRMLEVASKMMKVQNSPLRSGSLRRFITHTEPTLTNMQRKLEAEGSSPNPTMLAQVGRVGTMLKDAQNMLSNPDNSTPAVYKR